MAFDTPATIAIIGGGPIGLEAALYARFLGYQVEIFEQGAEVCQHVRHWGHVELFTPFAMNSSSLARAAIDAQTAEPTGEYDEDGEDGGDETENPAVAGEPYIPPADDDFLTGDQWIDRYLLPLSQTDLLIDSLHLSSRVVAVGRGDTLKHEHVGDETRSDRGFRILVETSGESGGYETEYEADIVIDAAGVLSQPNWLGSDGAPAKGERAARTANNQLERDQQFLHSQIPNFKDQSDAFADKAILVVGNGYSAATTICELEKFASVHPETRVTWLTRCEKDARPIAEVENDSLPQRASLAQRANELAADSNATWLTYLPETSIAAMNYLDGQCRVSLKSAEPEDRHSWKKKKKKQETDNSIAFDHVVAHVGYRPDTELFRELQVHQCYATEGPMRLAAKLMESAGGDCLAQNSHGSESLITTEPDFYVLGAKSYGRNSNFLYSIGLDQIRELFALIGDRADLDLYSSNWRLTS